MFLIAFAINHLIMFIIDVIIISDQPKNIESSREICNHSITEKIYKFNKFDTNYITIMRMFSNVWNMLTLHIFHLMIFIYLSMLSALIIHKQIINMKSNMVDLFITNQISENRIDQIVRKERQNLVYRLESKIYGSFLTYTAIVFLMFIGFVCTQIVDTTALYEKNDLYKTDFIECKISHYFKLTMYFIYWGFGLIELIAIIYLNYKIFRILMKTLVQTYSLFKWNLKIWLFLSLVATSMHIVFVFPESGDRYGLLDLIPQGDRFQWLIVNFVADIITLSFSLYFVWFLRFHVIYPNLDSRNEIFFSMFAILHENYWPNDIKIKHIEEDQSNESTDKDRNLLLDDNKTNGNDSINSSDFINPIDDRRNFKLMKLKEREESLKDNRKAIINTSSKDLIRGWK